VDVARSEIAGKVVVVTGAGSGIGRALCVGFSNEGAAVVAIGRREGSLRETADLCAQPVMCLVANLSQCEECLDAIRTTLASKLRIDVLINNAAIAAHGPFLDKSVPEWAEVLAVNVVGVAACSHAVLPHMISQGYGRIITLTSRAAATPISGVSAYCASKAAVSALTRCLAVEVTSKHPNVLINDLIPGRTVTKLSSTGQDPESVYPFVRQLVLLPRGGPSGQAFFRGRPYNLFRSGQPLQRFLTRGVQWWHRKKRPVHSR
jgi:NAD(P)-dependent dehydrogenase (short-subunit alcohol dehydrogenase family)